MSITALLGLTIGQTVAQTIIPPPTPPGARPCDPAEAPCLQREAKIVFSSTRDNPALSPLLAAEIYLMNPDTTDPVRLTTTAGVAANAFAALSPDGKLIVFDSNRLRAEGEPLNTSDLFVMRTDGSEQTHLIRGSSATWSPDGKNVAFHASASGAGLPIKPDPGAATTDSDIFVLNLDDFLENGTPPTNITNSPLMIDDDPSWSPDGHQIVATRHDVNDSPTNSVTAEIWVINVDGSGEQRLTFNGEEERAPTWSPDGFRILYMCRKGTVFQLCVMNADGSGQTQLTSNGLQHLTPAWSLDGQTITFHRSVPGGFELFVMNADGTGETQLTNTAGLNAFASFGEVLIPGRQPAD